MPERGTALTVLEIGIERHDDVCGIACAVVLMLAMASLFRIALMLRMSRTNIAIPSISRLWKWQNKKMTPIFPDCGGCVTGGFLLRCAWLRFWHASHIRHSVALHITDSCSLWCDGGLVPCFWLWKISILCKNGDLKSSILCMLYLGCHDFQYFPQCHRGYCAWDQPSEKEDDDGLNPREHSLQNQADFAGNKHSLCS